MAQDRYILNFNGNPPLPDDDMRLIRSITNLVDATRKTLVVEAREDGVMNDLARQLPNWTVEKEIQYTIPTTHLPVQKPPKL